MIRMKTKLRLIVISYLVLGLLISACAQQDQGPPETSSDQQAAEQATALPASEASETAPVEVDLSNWGQSSLAVYSADGSLLAVSASYDGIYVYDSLSLQQISYIPEAYDILDIAFSADSKFISVAYLDSSQNAYGVQQVELATNAEISNSVVLARGDNYQQLTLGSLSPDGNTFALYDDVEGVLTFVGRCKRGGVAQLRPICLLSGVFA